MKTFVVGCATCLVLGCGSGEPSSSYSEPPTSEAPVSTVQPRTARLCDDTTAVLIGRLYFIANPLIEQTEPERIEEFVTTHAMHLGPTSAFMSCAKHAASRLTAAAYASFDARQADSAYGRVLEMGGSMEDANHVRGSLNRGSLELMTMGQELMWLTQVVPSAAAGDWRPFMATPATDARQAIRMVWPMVQSVSRPDDIGVVKAAFAAYQPWLVYQVAILVLQAG